jgi:hypothetical protein
MGEWKQHDKSLHHVGPHWFRVFGERLTGTVFGEPTAEGRFVWHVADGQEAGAKTFRQGLAPSIGEAKASADAAVLDRKRGRGAAVAGDATSSTDRNRRRIDRLLASETLARGLIEGLTTYRQELVAAGAVEPAERIALALRRAALGGLSDYMRRTATVRSSSGSRMASSEEMQEHEAEVLKIADELDELADDPTATAHAVETIANKLRQRGAFPDEELYFAAVQSFPL